MYICTSKTYRVSKLLVFIKMVNKLVPKKRVVITKENLSEQLQEELKARYPLGVFDSMIRINKPNGDFFYGVVLEMPDVTYLVKLKVKVDKIPAEEIEKEMFDDDQPDDEIKNIDDVVADDDDTDQ